MARASYSAEVRQAVLAAVATGTPVAELAQRFGVPEGTIYSWLSRGEAKGEAFASLARLAKEESGEELGTKLYAHLNDQLTTLAELSRIFRSEDWLRKQSAADLAALYSQISDRAFQLVSAFQEPAESDALPD